MADAGLPPSRHHGRVKTRVKRTTAKAPIPPEKTASREASMESGLGDVWVQRLLVALFVVLALVAWSRFATGFLLWP